VDSQEAEKVICCFFGMKSSQYRWLLRVQGLCWYSSTVYLLLYLESSVLVRIHANTEVCKMSICSTSDVNDHFCYCNGALKNQLDNDGDERHAAVFSRTESEKESLVFEEAEHGIPIGNLLELLVSSDRYSLLEFIQEGYSYQSTTNQPD